MSENEEKHGVEKSSSDITNKPSRPKAEKSDVEGSTISAVADKESEADKDHHDRIKKLTQLLTDIWPTSSGVGRINTSNLLQLPTIPTTATTPLPVVTATAMATPTPAVSPTPSASSHFHHQQLKQQLQQQQQQLLLNDDLRKNAFYRTVCASFQSAILLMDMDTGEFFDLTQRSLPKDGFGTQRVYKKTSPNCVLTLYLPTREIILSGNTPSILHGIIYVDPKAIQGYRVYAQLTLTFRYGREDEEVMGLRFCNEAIMSLHQVWPRNEEPARDSLSPLQEALVKRLGDGAHPFTLTLTPQAPPSVQLVPAKRYYGAPIGTSYDVRCFIADKTDEKFHRRASVKMGVRVIYRTDVFHYINGPENFAALLNNQTTSPPPTTAKGTLPPAAFTAVTAQQQQAQPVPQNGHTAATLTTATTVGNTNFEVGGGSIEARDRTIQNIKSRKSERGDSFPKLRLSPKSFRFSGRFGRSKSEIEKCPNDTFYNYSKSFQEYDSNSGSGGCGSTAGLSSVVPGAGSVVSTSSGGGPQGAVDKPFLLQDGRVGLRASLDKAWYTHGEDVLVTVNIRNDSRKTVRKIRVCAIQHVDVCMFNNGKFKNIVADSDVNSPGDRTVPPGGTLSTTIVLKPQRGQTKNWIALEDTLQRSTEPEEITGVIAASAIRSPNLLLPTEHNINACSSPAVGTSQSTGYIGHGVSGNVGDDRNVFAIYVSYYVKVKLTLSGMGGELSLKLPFVLVHVDEQQRASSRNNVEKLALDNVPIGKKNAGKAKLLTAASTAAESTEASVLARGHLDVTSTHALDCIESADDEIRVPIPSNIRRNSSATRRRLVRSETLAKDLDEDIEAQENVVTSKMQASSTTNDIAIQSPMDTEQVHVVQIHTSGSVAKTACETEAEPEQSKEENRIEKHGQITSKETTNETLDIESLPQPNEVDEVRVELPAELSSENAADNDSDGNKNAQHV